MIADTNGVIIANSNADRRSKVIGMNVSKEEWFKRALETKDGTEYFVQDVSNSELEEMEALVYSTALRADGDEQGEVIGAMGVLFDFQGESQIILNDYLPKDANEQTLKVGSRSLLTKKEKSSVRVTRILYPVERLLIFRAIIAILRVRAK